MKYFFPILLVFSFIFYACSPDLNGKMVSDMYEKGFLAMDGEQFPIPGYAEKDAVVCYLVRHAEKASGPDPELTDAGTERARKLGNMLENVSLKGIYSTQTKRTVHTATPSAEKHKMEIDSYNARKQEELVTELKARKGEQFLIVGHSNSIPNMLNLFQEKKVYDHIDESVYDNFYVLIIDARDKVKIIELKY